MPWKIREIEMAKIPLLPNSGMRPTLDKGWLAITDFYFPLKIISKNLGII